MRYFLDVELLLRAWEVHEGEPEQGIHRQPGLLAALPLHVRAAHHLHDPRQLAGVHRRAHPLHRGQWGSREGHQHLLFLHQHLHRGELYPDIINLLHYPPQSVRRRVILKF